jgi:hypothetical protein
MEEDYKYKYSVSATFKDYNESTETDDADEVIDILANALGDYQDLLTLTLKVNGAVVCEID